MLLRTLIRPGQGPADRRGGRMLTRLEVDGFKNLLGLTVELGPFTCIAEDGRQAVRRRERERDRRDHRILQRHAEVPGLGE
jgi:hypothetical protein